MLTLLYLIDAARATLDEVVNAWLRFTPLVILLELLVSPVVGLVVLLGSLVRQIYATPELNAPESPRQHRRGDTALSVPAGNLIPVPHVQTVVPPVHDPRDHPIFGAPVPRPGGFRR